MGVLHLVRHGQASFGSDDYDVLSDAGHQQARVLGAWLAAHGPAPATVVHGGLRRHRETWAGTLEGAGWAGVPDALVASDWDEFDFQAVLARYSGLTDDLLADDVDRREFQAYFERATGHWIGHTEEGEAGYDESFSAFVERSRRALRAAARLDGPVVAVTSGGVIAALAAVLLSSGDPEAAPDLPTVGTLWERLNTVVVNTSVTRVLLGATGARLLTFNEHPHLPRELRTYR
ncbi:histidine phosphatase family protein [Nocardioides sambongensis]|uniref:histidine phosphatase family protein n=1 Tax=Nocardioides sambongensis TaxID=2589074 RepID=UPI00112E8A2F|nr:histidine phosphatase family protein [Nocardioides sambongensis]